MPNETPKLLVCDCEKSVSLSPDELEEIAGGKATCTAFTSLCRAQMDALADALSQGETLVACAQEAERFEALAEELELDTLAGTVDLRDRALWSEEAAQAGPKVAALLAESRSMSRPAGSIDIESTGVCLVYGPQSAAMHIATRLAPHLTVTAMLSDEDEVMAPVAGVDLVRGKVRRASGYLGHFEIVADGVAAAIPGGRGAVAFASPRDGGKSRCDVIVDASGGTALFAAHGKRDGYLRVDPADPVAIEAAIAEAIPLIGTFEKTLYVNFHADLCAHSRSGQPGCTRCLDVCPTGAIVPDGETVKIDPMICAGCGSCSAVCPSGAAEYALPTADDSRRRLEAMLRAYVDAGGIAPRLLVHDDTAGRETIAMLARFGRGLPAATIPFAVNEVTQIGHDLLIGAFAMGAEDVLVHLPERVRREGEADAFDAQLALTRAMLMGAGLEPTRLRVAETDDPDALGEMLYEAAPGPLSHAPVNPVGDKRSATRLSLQAMAAGRAPFSLPDGAPYGQIIVNTQSCTLCLACVSQCPVGAILDNPDKPQLRFRESACLQCGICESTCPENAIALEARFDPSPTAREPRLLHEDEPFACVECGKPFGSRATVERIMEKLGGAHWMFENPERTRVIQMCDDCRVQAVFRSSDNPFQMGERPRVRTTDDYLDDGGGTGRKKLDS